MLDQAATPTPGSSSSRPKTRRAVLAGAAGSLVALLASRLAGPNAAAAAAGDPLILGASNTAGTANTTVTTSSTGTALLVTQNGTGTALRGSAVGPDSIAGFFTANNGTGISGVTGRTTSIGVYGANDAATFGGGAAVRAAGKQNHGLSASATDPAADAVRAVHAGSGTAVRATATSGTAIEALGDTGLNAEATGTAGIGVDGLASGTGATTGVRGTADTGVEGVGATVGVSGHADDASATTYGVSGYSQSTAGTGVQGLANAATGATTGVYGRASSSAGIGVKGVVTHASAAVTGVRGETSSTNGIGVRGVSTAVTGNSAAIVATTASTGGIGVFAQATAATGYTYGVFGETTSTTDLAAGVWGLSNASTGSGVGVYGQTYSTEDSAGVLGWAWATTGTAAGVNGIASSPNGIGVFGIAGPSPSIGVLGSATGNGYGVVSAGNAQVQGNLDVTGSISKGGGGFKVDHPLDPANKFLSHSFVESPDMKNIYDGVVTLDGSGEATVALPDWFDAVNRDLRYQLTPIGASAPVFIRSKAKAGRFTIAGGAAGQEVSWQVTGIRKDAWADAHRIPVEEPKTGAQKGRYLHPAEHGQPTAKGIGSSVARRAILKAPKRPTLPA